MTRRCTQMHFGENQLSRNLIGLSPLAPSHPPGFQPRWVRSSTRSYPRFNLLRARSSRFGSRTRDFKRLLRLAFATHTPHGLCSPHATDSQTHFSIGTPSPHKRAPTDCRRTVSETVSLPSRGTFHLSLTVLVRYRSDRNIQAYPTVWADSHGVPRDPCYLGDAIGRPCAFRYGALTLCGPVFNPVPLTHGFLQLPAGPSEPAHAIPQHPARNPRRVSHAQGLAIIRFRSPLLTEYPFLQVLRCFTSLRTPRPKPVPTHDGRWVPPFGNPRIKALSAAPRGISQPQTSFIGPVCQGIHHTPLQATHTRHACAARFLQQIPRRQIITLKMITKRSKRTTEFDSKSTAKQGSKKTLALLASTIQFSSHHAPPRRRTGTRPALGHDGHRIAPGKKAWGGDPGAQKRIRTTPAPTARPAGQSQRHLPHQQPRHRRTMRRGGRTPSDEHPTEFSVERR